MKRKLAGLALALCLALLAAGCGSGDDSSTTTSTTASTGEASSGDTTTASDRGSQPAKPKGPARQGSGKEGSDQPAAGGSGSGGGSGFEAAPGGDDSIQTFGSESSGEEKSEVTEAMFAFFEAMANSDYAGVCEGLTSSNVEQLETFLKLKDKQGSCATVLEEVLTTHGPEARKAAKGTVYQVREEDGNAFILFTPEGGQPSYFVMKSEGGEWKSTSVTTGTPLNPSATIGN